MGRPAADHLGVAATAKVMCVAAAAAGAPKRRWDDTQVPAPLCERTQPLLARHSLLFGSEILSPMAVDRPTRLSVP